jgi:hypothetical protein
MEETATVLTIREIADYMWCSKVLVANLITGRVPGTRPLANRTRGRKNVVRKMLLKGWLDAIEHRSTGQPGQAAVAIRTLSLGPALTPTRSLRGAMICKRNK